MAYLMGKPEIDAATRVIRSQHLFRYGGAGETGKFEKEFARFTGAHYAVAMTSGTASLMAGLAALGVGLGDEVIVPGYTFIATPLAVLALGAVPVIADVDDCLMLDPLQVKKKISRRTKCIIPVHMLGLIADMGPLLKVAGKIPLLEDCAQATGGAYRRKQVGTWGKVGAFSHNHYKTMSAGEGGTLICGEARLYERAKLYHDAAGYYFDPRYKKFKLQHHAGLQFRMNEVQAAILRAQLKRLPGMLKSMRAVKKRLFDGLRDHPICPSAPVHDLAGDCGKSLILRLDSPARATRLADKLNQAGISTHSWFRNLMTDRHIYQTWTCILEKRGNFDKRQDPYKVTPAGRAVRYAKDMCPKTLDLLGRSVALNLHPNWDRAKVERVLKAVEKTAASL